MDSAELWQRDPIDANEAIAALSSVRSSTCLQHRLRCIGASSRKGAISSQFNDKQQAFLDFVLAHYVDQGVHELDQDKLTPLLLLRYNNSIADALDDLGQPEGIRTSFAGFQQYLYQGVA